MALFNSPMTNCVARGKLLLQQRRYDLAETEFRRALAQDPDDLIARGMQAICLKDQGRHTDAKSLKCNRFEHRVQDLMRPTFNTLAMAWIRQVYGEGSSFSMDSLQFGASVKSRHFPITRLRHFPISI